MSIAKRWQIKRPLVWALINVLILVGLAIPAIWELVPASYTFLTGRHVQGVVYLVKDCGTDDDGNETYEQTFLYQDAQGQLQESASGSDCVNDFSNGQAAGAWYIAARPGSVVIDDGSQIIYLVFAVLDLAGMLAALAFLLYCLWVLIRACRQAENFTRLLLVALGCVVSITPLLVMLQVWPPPAQQSGNGPTQNFQVGQTVTAEQRWAVTIQGGQEGALNAPHAGNACLEVTITLRNITRQQLPLQKDQFTLFDAQIKPVSATCQTDTPGLGNATLAPGATMQVTNVYEVPASARQFYLAFQPNPQGEDNVGRYFWDIQATPAPAAP